MIVLLALLSLTVLNDQFGSTRKAAHMRAGRLAAEERDYDTAIEQYQMVIGLDRRNAEAYLRLSEACVYNGDVDSAIYYLEKGIEKTSSDRLRETLNELLTSLEAQAPEEPPVIPDTDPSPMPSPAPEPSVAASPSGAPPIPSPGEPAVTDASPSPGAPVVPDSSPSPDVPVATDASPSPEATDTSPLP